jgi:murein L,D-transpeptidase YcbB/YkuD
MLSGCERWHARIESRIIVGAQKDATPESQQQRGMFYDLSLLACATQDLRVEDLLPIHQRDTSFITRNNFDVTGPEGTSARHQIALTGCSFNKKIFPVSLRQRREKEYFRLE